ncbi:MAG: hypothetical protein ABID09_01180 [Candidatus Omnitrophota bacterium]
MAQERRPTPERQLLNIIEDSRSKKDPKLKAHVIKHKTLSGFSFAAWISRVSFFKGRTKGWFSGGGARQIEIKAINRILILCVVILIGFFISNLSLSVARLRDPFVPAAEQGQGLGLATGAVTSALKKSVTYYLDKVAERDIFKMGAKKAPQQKKLSEKKAEVDPMGAVQHLKLVGISWSDNPDAMIEDTKAYRTFFVKRGQMIGEIKVKAIFKDKIILLYEGEEFELK